MHPLNIDMGLDRVGQVFARLNVEPKCPVITVSGTNGKGSTCAMLASILRAEGYRVGFYSSPHLVRFNERIRVDGEEISDSALATAFEKVDAARGDVPLTFFEFATLAAFVAFDDAQLDAWVLEVGLGGRLDATNLINADCAIVSSIGLDHIDYLGDTREKIVTEKMGIARKGKPLVLADAHPPTNAVAVATEIGCLTLQRGVDYLSVADGPTQWTYTAPDGTRLTLPYPSLRGEFQIHNAGAALTALHALRSVIPVRAQSIREGLLTTEWPGRFQVLPGRPTVVLDAAHNPDAAKILNDALGGMGYHPETIAVFGMLSDKDFAGVIAALKNRITQWHLVTTHGARGLVTEKIHNALISNGIAEKHIRCYASVEIALAAAQQKAEDVDRIVVFGSFHILGEAIPALERQRQSRPPP